MTYSEQLKHVNSVRLPLIIAVVFIHVQTVCEPHSADWWMIKVLGEEIGRIGVPLFFAISGMLFFNSFSYEDSLSTIMLQGGGKIKKTYQFSFGSIYTLEYDPVHIHAFHREGCYWRLA